MANAPSKSARPAKASKAAAPKASTPKASTPKAPDAKVQAPKAPGAKAAPAALSEPWDVVHAEFTAAAGPGSSLPERGPEVAFAGRSNVGKSSLINTLTGRRNLVRTGATPGVTRTLTQFAVRTRGGQAFAMVDLPGYGFAQRSKAERRQWADLIEGYLRERPQLVALILLVDARRGLEDDDRDLVEFVRASPTSDRPEPEIVLVATKIDKVSRSAQLATLAAVAASMTAGSGAAKTNLGRVIGFSSETGQGRSDLSRRIALALERASARR